MVTNIIIKVIRACNLRCPYCYYINDDTKDYGKIMSIEVTEALYKNLSKYIGDNQVALIWHGGEPMMVGTKRFRKFLELQSQYFNKSQIKNLIQTNGTIATKSWINLIKEYNIGIGISIDGVKEIHDKNRPTISGRGSYDKIMKNMDLFRNAGVDFGLLSVIDPLMNPKEYIEFLVQLGIRSCDLLLPMTNNAQQKAQLNQSKISMKELGNFLVQLFNEWKQLPKDKHIDIRLFDSLVKNAFGIPHNFGNAGGVSVPQNVILETNGQLGIDSEFYQIDRFQLGTEYFLSKNILEPGFSFQEVENELKLFIKETELENIPNDCQNCKMRSICRGSHPGSRYDSDGKYNHKSAYCDAMYPLSTEIFNFIKDEGLNNCLIESELVNI